MIVITTPTGNIGRQILENLLDSEESIRVIARDPNRIPEAIRKRIEIVQGSHADREIAERAFSGADSLLWVVPPDFKAKSVESAYVDFTRPACDVFRRGEVNRVVVVSALGRGWPKNAGLVSASLAMDDLINSTGINSRVLSMPSFMDNLLRQLVSIREQSAFFSPIAPDLKAPTCATRDIASVAAKLLLEPSWVGQSEIPILGPENLSFNDMARIISEVLGKPVRYQQTPMDAFRARLISAGMSEAMAQAYEAMMIAKNEGMDNMEPRTAQSSSPTHFRQWCEEVLRPAVFQ